MSDDAGWLPTPDVGEPAEEVELTDIDLIDDLTHPVRGALMRRLRRPRTVAELAEELDVPVTRLYHHVNRLEQLGLIQVVATRRVGAVTERRYQVTAKSFKMGSSTFEELDGVELAHKVGALFDVAKIAMQRWFESGDHRTIDLEEDGLMSLSEVRMSPDRRRELVRRLRELIDEYHNDGDSDDGERTMLFVATHPTEGG